MSSRVLNDDTLRRRARTLAANLEPVIGQVFFAPECHAAYEQLGFGPSPAKFGNGVAAPDGPAYFTSRGSLLGQVEPEVVASAFGVFKPAVVVGRRALRLDAYRRGDDLRGAGARRGRAARPRVRSGRSGRARAPRDLLERAVDPLAEPGRPLFAGLRAQWDDPADPWTRLFHLGDMLREYRGDAHVCAWSTAGVDAIEIGLLTEAYMGLPLRTYIRTRAWNDAELDGAVGAAASPGLARRRRGAHGTGRPGGRRSRVRPTARWPRRSTALGRRPRRGGRVVGAVGRGDAGRGRLRRRARSTCGPIAPDSESGAISAYFT